MAWQTDFLVEATAGLVGVFVGVLLALWTERSRQRAAERRANEQGAAEFEAIRATVLSSVVKNTLEAKRIKTRLTSGDDPYLLSANLEHAVWRATQSEYVRRAPIDDRVLLSRFFDRVERMDRLLDFFREARADARLTSNAPESARNDELASRLGDVAEDLRLEGVIIVTDHGNPDQKRLLGLG